jgi:GAF domain-containing protein
MAQDRTRASLRLLYNVGRELASSLDLRTVLGRVLILSTDYVGAERGTLIVLDDQQRPVEAAIVYNHELLTYTFKQLQMSWFLIPAWMNAGCIARMTIFAAAGPNRRFVCPFWCMIGWLAF